MSVHRILQLGDPLLRQRSLSIIDAAGTLLDLQDTLHAFQSEHGFGRGISAVQIGRLERVVFIEFEGAKYSLINPEFLSMSADKFTLWDDCFSFPNLLVKLERSVSVEVRYTDEMARSQVLMADGELSELLQHELDHLDGVLAVDRALDGNSLATREEWLRQKVQSELLTLLNKECSSQYQSGQLGFNSFRGKNFLILTDQANSHSIKLRRMPDGSVSLVERLNDSDVPFGQWSLVSNAEPPILVHNGTATFSIHDAIQSLQNLLKGKVETG